MAFCVYSFDYLVGRRRVPFEITPLNDTSLLSSCKISFLQVASPNYDKTVNKFKVKCGTSLESWEESGWIVSQDPYGWFQWYCRFYQVGRNLIYFCRKTS